MGVLDCERVRQNSGYVFGWQAGSNLRFTGNVRRAHVAVFTDQPRHRRRFRRLHYQREIQVCAGQSSRGVEHVYRRIWRQHVAGHSEQVQD